MRHDILILGLAAALAAPAAGAADELSVEAQRRGGAIEVRARAVLEAPLSLIWATLTDYNRLSEFIPGMLKSRVIERDGARVVVEQSGRAQFLFFSFPIEVTLESTERPPHAIDVRALKGSLRQLDGGYRIAPDGERALLTWRGLVDPVEELPPLLEEVLMRLSIEDQFRGMVAEIERRERARREREGKSRP
jgi:ribosome-associated toxin RatA of RatAB toxin-antitoxin module